MALVNTAEVLMKLRERGSDADKQAYKSTLAGHYCVVYDPNKASTNEAGDPDLDKITVRAENLEHYIGKGFLVERAASPGTVGTVVTRVPAPPAGDTAPSGITTSTSGTGKLTAAQKRALAKEAAAAETPPAGDTADQGAPEGGE